MKSSGLLCRSAASTAVCVPGDPRSMIIPRRPDRTLPENARLIDLKYSSLGDHRRLNTAAGDTRRSVTSVTLPMVMKKHGDLSKPTTGGSSTVQVRSLPSPNRHAFQVVVMRVAIHCQGCAGKVRKHISKMEGVTSFSIDLDSKRVTVMGHVSPTGVLESISKVKKAEFWPCSRVELK